MLKRKVFSSRQSCDNSNGPPPKRRVTVHPILVNDVYSRAEDTKTHGRGALSGWAECPLCNGSKKYALGRGISMHIQQVHTPWKPGKAELARRERIRRRIHGIVYRIFQNEDKELVVGNDKVYSTIPDVEDGESQHEYKERVLKQFLGDLWNRDGRAKPIQYEPSDEERQTWSKKVLNLAQEIELMYEADISESSNFVQAGFDRNGTKVHSYKESLPPFIKAASDGDIDTLKEMVHDARKNDEINDEIRAINILLETKDRNGSSAEHWAAGNGHLECLRYLMDLVRPKGTCQEQLSTKKLRKRDGKTALHYAARNGHINVIEYLLDVRKCPNESSFKKVDLASGDGTTPLHLACYGGHLETMKHLIEVHGADISNANEWGCGVGHWIAMSIHPDTQKIRCILDYIKGKVGSASFDIFGRAQKQGHSSVHKAAQKLNRGVIEWLAIESREWTAEEKRLAGSEDNGGNKPSAIWKKLGGSTDFEEWMRKEMGW